MNDETTGTPVWVFVVVVGGGIVLGWWILGLLLGTVAWLVRGALLAVVVGVIVYLVLTALGRQPGRRD